MDKHSTDMWMQEAAHKSVRLFVDTMILVWSVGISGPMDGRLCLVR